MLGMQLLSHDLKSSKKSALYTAIFPDTTPFTAMQLLFQGSDFIFDSHAVVQTMLE